MSQDYKVDYEGTTPIRLYFEPAFSSSTGESYPKLGKLTLDNFPVPGWRWTWDKPVDHPTRSVMEFGADLTDIDPLTFPDLVAEAQESITRMMDKLFELRNMLRVLREAEEK